MSNYVKTTNFLRKDSLPDTDTDKIIRGSEFDTEFNNLVTAVASKANTVSPALTGIPTAPTADPGTNSTQIATTAFVTQNAVLKGMIVMWSGAVATIPTGYALCDGSNGTPDLRDRMVMGAGSTYTPGDTGGSKDAVAVSHSHTANVIDNGHSHTVASKDDNGGGGGGTLSNNLRVPDQNTPTTNVKTGISVSINTSGSSGTNKNLPPYYALAFIMKT